jgi:hypothetical protein
MISDTRSPATHPRRELLDCGYQAGEARLPGHSCRVDPPCACRTPALPGRHGWTFEVLVSQTVKDLVPGSGLQFDDAGEHQLKGVPGPWRLHKVIG